MTTRKDFEQAHEDDLKKGAEDGIVVTSFWGVRELKWYERLWHWLKRTPVEDSDLRNRLTRYQAVVEAARDIAGRNGWHGSGDHEHRYSGNLAARHRLVDALSSLDKEKPE